MKAVLIGSRAYKDTDYGDTDIICDAEWKAEWDKSYGCIEEPQESKSARYDSTTSKYDTCGGIFEVIIPPPGGAHARLIEHGYVAHGEPTWGWQETEIEDLKVKVAPLVYLAALKKAHLILPSSSPEKWARQMREYVALKKAIEDHYDSPDPHLLIGSSSVAPWNEIYKLHRAECLERAKKHPKLNMTKDAFFNQGSEGARPPYEVFDHDTIHEAIAYPRVPAYTLMKDGEVWCSKALWDKLPATEKLRCVTEEASILALERSVIPALFLDKPYRGSAWAYSFAIYKLSTTISSGWFRDYCIEAHQEVMASKPDFISQFFDGLKRGIVRCVRPEVLG